MIRRHTPTALNGPIASATLLTTAVPGIRLVVHLAAGGPPIERSLFRLDDARNGFKQAKRKQAALLRIESTWKSVPLLKCKATEHKKNKRTRENVVYPYFPQINVCRAAECEKAVDVGCNKSVNRCE